MSFKSIVYGKCIGARYNEVSKGMCEAEFQAFKDCVQVLMSLLVFTSADVA